jgi:hypothetical protein
MVGRQKGVHSLIPQPREPAGGGGAAVTGCGGRSREVGGAVIDFSVRGGQRQVLRPSLGELGFQGKQRELVLLQLQLDVGCPGIGMMGFLQPLTPTPRAHTHNLLGRAQETQDYSPFLLPNSFTRNRIIPALWGWGGRLLSEWPVRATAGIPQPGPLPSPPGQFAKSLQDFPDFLPAASGCGWGGGGDESASPPPAWVISYWSLLCVCDGGST